MRWWVPLLLVACGEPEPAQQPVEVVDTVEVPEPLPDFLPAEQPLTPLQWMVRASLDLRGVRPTLEELDQLEADPTRVEQLVAGFVEDRRFPSRVAALMSEVYQTLDERAFVRLEYYLEEHSRDELVGSIGREPLQLLARIAADNLPYTTLMTADWTVVNPTLSEIWPVRWKRGDKGWQKTRYTDGRPAAGVLATNGMWWQHGSMVNNLNRGRANTFSRVFLCFDYLDHELDFNTTTPLDSEEALGEAVRTDRSCSACHDALDPLASHFFGFWYYTERKTLPSDAPMYHPEREQLWRTLDGLPPAFEGERTNGLADLAARTAADPRFPACFAKQSMEGVLRRSLGPDDDASYAAALARFEEELVIRDLFRALVFTRSYREGKGAEGRKLISPTTLASQVLDLTGFAFTQGERDLMMAPRDGFAALGGGVDGLYRFTMASEPSATTVLLHTRLAEAAAYWVVDHQLGSSSSELLPQATSVDSPLVDEVRIRQQIALLYRRILSQSYAYDDQVITDLFHLWSDVYAVTHARDAWKVVLAAILRDPALVYY